MPLSKIYLNLTDLRDNISEDKEGRRGEDNGEEEERRRTDNERTREVSEEEKGRIEGER